MATEKQKKAVDNMAENGGNVSKAMKDAGYSDETAKTPQKLTESKGFRELCDERGLTDNLILDALVDDIKVKEGNRKAELELGAKIRGMLNEKLDLTSGGEKIQYVITKGNQSVEPTQESVDDNTGQEQV